MIGGIISELNGGSFSQGAIIAAASAAASMGLSEMTKTSQSDGTTRVGEDADTKAQGNLNVNEVESVQKISEFLGATDKVRSDSDIYWEETGRIKMNPVEDPGGEIFSKINGVCKPSGSGY